MSNLFVFKKMFVNPAYMKLDVSSEKNTCQPNIKLKQSENMFKMVIHKIVHFKYYYIWQPCRKNLLVRIETICSRNDLQSIRKPFNQSMKAV